MQRHWIWDNPIYLKGWLTILLNVNFEDKKVLIGSELVECKAGEAVYSLQSWTKLLGKGWTIRKTRTFFTLLKEDEMIVTKGMRKTTRLTVCNYELYQISRQANDKQTTSKRQANDKQTTTTKEYKEVKKEKNNMGGDYLELLDKVIEKNNIQITPEFKELVIQWLRYKSEKRQSYKEIGLKNFLVKVVADTGGRPAELESMIIYSTSKNYDGLFKEKQDGTNKQNHSGQIKNVNDKWR